ncbi:MAG: hypothetical protein ABL967_08535 [Bryobacteraceae bacterium]
MSSILPFPPPSLGFAFADAGSFSLCSILVSSQHRMSGFDHLAPSAIISSFVAPSMVTMQTGGLPLLAGMDNVDGAGGGTT